MQFLKKILKDRFLKNNLVLFVGSLVIGFLNYAFHPVLGRIMSTEDFGEVQALISLIAQLGVITSCFGIVVTNLAANIKENQERVLIISEVRKAALYISGFVFVLIVFSSSFFSSFLQFNSLYPFLILSIMVPMGVVTMFRNAFLQGQQKFVAVSIGGIISSVSRLFFASLLVYLGYKSFGAIIGMFVAQLIAFWYYYSRTRKDLSYLALRKTVFSSRVKKELVYGFLVLIVTSTITFLYTSDVLIIKHFFNPIEAGLYSGVATVARILFFLNGPLAIVLFSSVTINNDCATNQKLLAKSLTIIMLIGVTTLLFFTFFSDIIIKLLVGSRYLTYAILLPKLGLLIFLVSIIQTLFYYNLALRRFLIIPVALVGLSLILVLSYFSHGSMDIIIRNFIIGSLVIVASLLLLSLRSYFFKKIYVQK